MTDKQTWSIHHESGVLAQESYARFRESYEVEHGLVLADWTTLDVKTQARWQHMFVPVAEMLIKADEAVRSALLLEEEHRALLTRYDRDAAGLAELERLVAVVSERLPDAALLADLPAPLLAALAPLYTRQVAGRAPEPAVDSCTTLDAAASAAVDTGDSGAAGGALRGME